MKMLAQWRKVKRTDCTEAYVLSVRRAITMFRHCWVYDEKSKTVINKTPYTSRVGYPFNINMHLDPKPDESTAMGIYRGDLHPMTLVWSSHEVNIQPLDCMVCVFGHVCIDIQCIGLLCMHT